MTSGLDGVEPVAGGQPADVGRVHAQERHQCPAQGSHDSYHTQGDVQEMPDACPCGADVSELLQGTGSRLVPSAGWSRSG